MKTHDKKFNRDSACPKHRRKRVPEETGKAAPKDTEQVPWHECPICWGTGLALGPYSDQVQNCPDCDGSGRIYETEDE